MNEKEQPAPPLRAVGVELTRQNKCAVYFLTTFEDANGKRWAAWSASFLYDLKPVEEKIDVPREADVERPGGG